jgi:uncharacterized membrane protein (DUF2068 family)
MKRPTLVTVTIVVQLLLGLVLAGISIYLFVLTRSAETLSEPDAADTVRGLLIGAGVLGVPAVITLVSVIGLWKRRFWGWVLAFATNVGMLAVMVYSMVGDGDRDTDEIAITAGITIVLALLLLPAVRKFYWQATEGQI